MIRDTVKHYFIALFVFLVMDAVWLGLIARPFYQAQIGFLLAEKANWAAAGVFYLLYVIGVPFVSPNSRASRTRRGCCAAPVAESGSGTDLVQLDASPSTIDRRPRPACLS